MISLAFPFPLRSDLADPGSLFLFPSDDEADFELEASEEGPDERESDGDDVELPPPPPPPRSLSFTAETTLFFPPGPSEGATDLPLLLLLPLGPPNDERSFDPRCDELWGVEEEGLTRKLLMDCCSMAW